LINNENRLLGAWNNLTAWCSSIVPVDLVESIAYVPAFEAVEMMLSIPTVGPASKNLVDSVFLKWWRIYPRVESVQTDVGDPLHRSEPGLFEVVLL
jgi:hypothetical protein